jgi:hypothetical protein
LRAAFNQRIPALRAEITVQLIIGAASCATHQLTCLSGESHTSFITHRRLETTTLCLVSE